jgi:large subunit ribosomal protein L9
MEVLLVQNVENLGSKGEVITVRNGYARNYLIPQGMAVLATPSQHRILQEKNQQEQMQDKKRKRNAEELASKYTELSCTITVQAGEDDTLFGSVTNRDIATALTDQDIEVDHKQIDIEEPIKKLGVYTVPVKLHPEVEVLAKVWVVKA